MAYSREIIEKIKDTARIEDYAGRFTRLSRVGGRLKGLCPLHEEKTPSFTVNPEGGYFKCFGCGAGGDIFELRMQLENLTFHEALKEFARECRIELEQTEFDLEQMTRETLILKANKQALDFFRECLSKKECAAIAAYLDGRGYSRETIDKFALGASIPEDKGGWDALKNFMRPKGFDERVLHEAGLAVHNEQRQSYYDRFRGRLIFPIRAHTGKPVAFSGRSMTGDDGAKYVNTPETPIFTKGRHLYGLYEGKKEIAARATAVLVEGYTDVMRFHEKGLPIAIAGMGTALTSEQASLIHRFAETVIVAYDSDSAGKEAAIKNVRVLRNEGLSVRVLELPEGEDPDSFLNKIPIEEIEQQIESATDHFSFMLRVLSKDGVPATLEDRINRFRRLSTYFSLQGNPVQIKDQISRAARSTGLTLSQLQDENLVPNQVKNAISRHQTRPKDISVGSQGEPYQEERLVLSLLLRFPEKENLTLFKKLLRPVMFEDPVHRDLASLLMELSSPARLAGLANDPEIVEHETLNRLIADLNEVDNEGREKDFAIYVERVLRRNLEMQASEMELAISRAEMEGDDEKKVELMKRRGKIQSTIDRIKNRFHFEV